MSFLLYALTAALTLFLVRRYVAPVDLPYATAPLAAMRLPLGVGAAHNGLLSDVAAQVIPWRQAVRDAYAHGEWPLWNRFILSGEPLAGSAQSAPYSPLTLLACLLPVAKSITFTAALHFFLAALGAFLLARELGCGTAAALVGAAASMYATNLSFFIVWSLGGAWLVLPFVLLGVRRCAAAPSLRSFALLLIAFTLLLLAGHPETALHVATLAAVYCLVELARRRRDAPRALARALACATAAGIVALLLCALFVLPIIEAAPQTFEHQYRTNVWSFSPHGEPLPQTFARLTVDVFPMLFARPWRRADISFPPLDSAAVGSVALALALFAIARRRDADSWFFAALALFGLLARGGFAPLLNVMQKLPLYGITLNERFSFAAAFALAMLAALACERLASEPRTFAVVAFVVLLLLTVGNVVLMQRPVVDGIDHLTFFAELAALGVAVAVALFAPRAAIVPALLLLVIGQRIVEVGNVYPTLPARVAYPSIPLLAPLQRIREPFRIVGLGAAFVPGTSALYGLEDVRGYEAMTFARYASTYPLWCVAQPVWFNRVDDLSAPMLSLLNVRFAIADDRAPLAAGWRVIGVQRGARLLENERVVPRAFLPRRVVFGRDAQTIGFAMRELRDPAARAWIEGREPPAERENAHGTLRITERGAALHIDAELDGDGWMVVSQPAWDGWRALVDGRAVRPQIADVTLLAVPLPRGRHVVELRFRPDAFVRGRAITLVTLVTLIGLAIVHRWRQREL